MPIPGENSVPLGRAGSGAAYVLGNDLAPLRILEQGARARALAAERARLAQLKADQENAKQFNDFAKFQQDGSPYFGEALNNNIYSKLDGQLTSAFKSNINDPFARNVAVRPLLQKADNETIQSKAKTQFINDQMRGFQADKKLYNTEYAGTQLSAALRGKEGTGLLPSQFDEETHFNNLRGDQNLYNEPEVIRRATDKLMPTISQKIAEAGSIGGQHTADQVRGRFVAFKNGKPILNADGSPKLNLTADTQALLEADPLLKLKLDAREQAYNQQREADPSLPRMSRRGHLSQMIGPMAFYDSSHDEGLNRLPPQPRAASSAAVIGFDESSVAPAEFGGTVDNRSKFSQFFNLGSNQQNFYSGRHAGAPVIEKKGVRKPVELRLTPRRLATEDANGNLSYRNNNTTPINGTAGEPIQLPTDPKTGEWVYPKSKEDEADYYRKGYKPATYVTVTADKNEKFFADKQKYLQQAVDANNSKFGSDKKTYAQLEAEAEKAVSRGTARVILPYDADNAASINQQAGSYYRDFHRGTLKYRQQSQPAPAPKPLYTPKTKAASTTPTTSSADPTGGLYKRRR